MYIFIVVCISVVVAWWGLLTLSRWISLMAGDSVPERSALGKMIFLESQPDGYVKAYRWERFSGQMPKRQYLGRCGSFDSYNRLAFAKREDLLASIENRYGKLIQWDEYTYQIAPMHTQVKGWIVDWLLDGR